MRAVNSAEATFAASCGGGGYATTLVDLGNAAGWRRPLHQPGPGRG